MTWQHVSLAPYHERWYTFACLAVRPMTKWVIAGAAMGGAMMMLRVKSSLFSALCTGFEAAVCNDDAPIRPQLLSRLRPALAAAAATAPAATDLGQARIDRRTVHTRGTASQLEAKGIPA